MNVEPREIEEVKCFWEKNPLYVGESKFIPCSVEFFDNHTSFVIEDCFAGLVDERILPTQLEVKSFPVSDAGCGIGLWLQQFAERVFEDVTWLDLASSALELASSRMAPLNSHFEFVVGNLEQLPISNEIFAHVNCQGVLHHTPNPKAALAEIARVLRPGGTASISVYYRNWILRNYDWVQPLVHLLAVSGGGLKGRGRESMRLYDGAENPIGFSYDQDVFNALLSGFLEVKETFLHFFPQPAFRWPAQDHFVSLSGFLIHPRSDGHS